MKEFDIKFSKIGIIGATLFISGLVLFGFGFPISLNSEITGNNIGTFSESNGTYVLQADLSNENGEYYIVAKFDGRTRRDIISMLDVWLVGSDGKIRKLMLSNKRTRSTDSRKFGWFGKEVIFGYISSKYDDRKHIKIVSLKEVGEVENLGFSLHSNSNWLSEAFIVLMSILLIVSGFVMMLINIAKLGYNNLLQRIKKSVAFFNR